MIDRIKLVVSDMDGAMTGSESQISERTKRALSYLKNHGVHTAVMTDRSFPSLPEDMKEQDCFEYMIADNGTSVFEVASSLCLPVQGVDRADGVAQLCQYLGINMSQVMAFGYGTDDIMLVAEAGIGIAMEDGCDDVKDVSQVTAPSSTDDGVAQTLELLMSIPVKEER